MNFLYFLFISLFVCLFVCSFVRVSPSHPRSNQTQAPTCRPKFADRIKVSTRETRWNNLIPLLLPLWLHRATMIGNSKKLFWLAPPTKEVFISFSFSFFFSFFSLLNMHENVLFFHFFFSRQILEAKAEVSASDSEEKENGGKIISLKYPTFYPVKILLSKDFACSTLFSSTGVTGPLFSGNIQRLSGCSNYRESCFNYQNYISISLKIFK